MQSTDFFKNPNLYGETYVANGNKLYRFKPYNVDLENLYYIDIIFINLSFDFQTTVFSCYSCFIKKLEINYFLFK